MMKITAENGDDAHGSELLCPDMPDATEKEYQDECAFERVMEELGMPGRYQVTQTIIIELAIVLFCSIIFSFVFIGYESPHVCNTVNTTQVLNSLQHDNDTSAYISYDLPCDISVLTNRSGTVEKIKDMSCPQGRNFTGGKKTSIVTEWDMVCESAGIAELVASMFSFGQIVGNALISPLSDMLGRRLITVACCVSFCILETVIIFAPNLAIIIIVRFINGCMLAGYSGAGFVLIMEMLTPRQRTMFGIVECMTWSVTTVLVGALAYFTLEYGWRGFQLVTVLFGMPALLTPFFVYESPRWLATNGKKRKAMDIIRVASKQNKKDYAIVCTKFEKYISAQSDKNKKGAFLCVARCDGVDTSLFKTFLQGKIISLTSILSIAWLTNNLVYYGMYMTSSTLSGNRFINFSLMALTEIPSNMVLYVMMPRFGRRNIMAIFLSLASVSLFVCSLVETFAHDEPISGTVNLVLFLIGKFAITASFNVTYIYSPELFPTKVRTFGNGLCRAIGRIGSVLAPYFIPFYALVSWGPPVTFCAMCFITLFLISFLPEMKGVNLKDTTHEMKGVNLKDTTHEMKDLKRKKQLVS